MAINIIEYVVNINGITPNTEQLGGTQGDHRVTGLEFALSSELYADITSAAADGKPYYRFDIYDGEGGIWQSEPQKLESALVNIELEERHTRFGGKVVVYLVITALSTDQETEIELYSFPAMLRLKNKPQGIYQEGENYESVTGLVEVAKNNAASAAASAFTAEEWAQNAESIVKQATVETIDRASSEADRAEAAANNAAESISLVADEVVKAEQAVLDAKSQVDLTAQYAENMENAIAEAIADIKIPDVDQTYKAESENAQSGVAVANAIEFLVPKVKNFGDPGAPFLSLLAIDNGDIDYDFMVPNDSAYRYLRAQTIDFVGKDIDVATQYSGFIPVRDANGNLWTSAPVDDVDCVNKKYVDKAIGNVTAGSVDLTDYVKNTDIQQNYNAESENAQSGKALAEAIEPITDELQEKVQRKSYTEATFLNGIGDQSRLGVYMVSEARDVLGKLAASYTPYTIPFRQGSGQIDVGLSAWDSETGAMKVFQGSAVPRPYLDMVRSDLNKSISSNVENLKTMINSADDVVKQDINKIIDEIKLTSSYTKVKTTLDWNSAYILWSNSGNADIELYNNATNARVTDTAGEELATSRACVLFLPESSNEISSSGTVTVTGKRGLYIGLTGTPTLLNLNAVCKQFVVDSGNLYFTPATAVSVFKIAL